MTDIKRGVLRGLPRDLYIAAVARAVSVLGNEIAIIALMLQFYDQDAGAWGIAGLIAAGTVPMVVFAPVIGLVIDGYDSRTLIILSGLWQSAGCLLLTFVHQHLAVLALVALNALGSAIGNPVFATLTKVMVPSGQLAAANGLQQGSNMIATVAGPALGGLLAGLTGGARVPLLIGAVTFLAITVAGLLISTRRRPEVNRRKQRIRDGITVLFTDRALAAVMVLAILLIVVGTAVGVAEVFLVRDTFHASDLAFGLLSATYTVGMLVGSVLSSRLDTARRILFGIPVAAAVMSICLAVIGLSGSLLATFPLYVVAGAGTGVVSVSCGTLLLLRTPEPVIGRALASFSALLRAAGLISYGLGGLVVGLLSPQVVYILCGSAALLAVLGTAPALRRAWAES